MENSFGVPLEYQKTDDNLPIKYVKQSIYS